MSVHYPWDADGPVNLDQRNWFCCVVTCQLTVKKKTNNPEEWLEGQPFWIWLLLIGGSAILNLTSIAHRPQTPHQSIQTPSGWEGNIFSKKARKSTCLDWSLWECWTEVFKWKPVSGCQCWRTLFLFQVLLSVLAAASSRICRCLLLLLGS